MLSGLLGSCVGRVPPDHQHHSNQVGMTKHGTSCDVEKATKEAGMQVPGGACIRAEGQVPGGGEGIEFRIVVASDH